MVNSNSDRAILLKMVLFVQSESILQIGCAFIAFAPSAVFTYTILSERSQLIIIALASAFLWLCSILVSASIWTLVPSSVQSSWPFVTTVGVLIQEIFRCLLIKLIFKVEGFIKTHIPPSTAEAAVPLNDITNALAAGVGFGTMHAVITYGSVLAENGGPGTLFVDSCPFCPLVLFSAFLALTFVILDVLLVVMMLSGLKQMNPSRILSVVFIHLVASYVTIFDAMPNGCLASGVLLVVILFWAGIMTRRIVIQEKMFLPDGEKQAQQQVLQNFQEKSVRI
mmetsp:Transcript_33303/g.43930  ORF Transcript_33303/g.43930 Transcript_33303/m.43930 type:complete len:281 (-) Transcript_33303:255-1097(-)